MLKKISIRIKLLIMVNAIITPIAILRILYLLISHNNTLIKDFGFSEVSITGIHSRIIKEELIILGIILLLTSISTLHFTGYFLKPVKLLQNTAKRIMEGDYSARTNIKSNDEIGMTAEAFDKMAESIETWGKESAGIIASLSHEIKTPLNVIFSSVQLIDSYRNNLDCSEFKKKVPAQINIIRQNCYRMMRLTNNLLDICRHDSGYLKAKLTNYDIVELAKDITLSVKRYAESKGINLIFETDIDKKTIACDPDMIERILLNLISNAIKFTNNNGIIKVKLTDENDNILLTVEDTGIGISKDRLNRIFEVFNKDENLVLNKEGTGLGLYLVKAFVEAHGGKIQVKSERSVGSEFGISLPAKALNQSLYPSVTEPQSRYRHITSYNGVQRVNIEFSDIYSGFEKETS
ncbi:MAG: ATP-binding protein [Acetivibrionales bacterium]|jgi:signal transduction histidine kinase